MSIALHACCGPCLIEPFDEFSSAEDVVVVFANPNIEPRDEYDRRLATLKSYASVVGARCVELPYRPEEWSAATARAEDQPTRCVSCYRLRLGMVARWAAENRIEAIATTLTVSPYQDVEAIGRVGAEVADAAGVGYVHRDFRDRYPSATRRARELGLYRQNYCGCLPSMREAEEARANRREERRALLAERESGAEHVRAGLIDG